MISRLTCCLTDYPFRQSHKKEASSGCASLPLKDAITKLFKHRRINKLNELIQMVSPANGPEITRNYWANRNFNHRVFNLTELTSPIIT